jgi:hypothetical protein
MSTRLVKRKENKHEKERRRRHMKCLLNLSKEKRINTRKKEGGDI